MHRAVEPMNDVRQSNMDEFSISLTIANRPYRLVINKEQEEFFRKAAKLIDKKAKEYSSNYAHKDNQDLLAMVALEYTVGYLQNEKQTSDEDQKMNQQLENIDRALTDLLVHSPHNVL